METKFVSSKSGLLNKAEYSRETNLFVATLHCRRDGLVCTVKLYLS